MQAPYLRSIQPFAFFPCIWAARDKSGKRAKLNPMRHSGLLNNLLLSSFSCFLKELLQNLTSLPSHCPCVHYSLQGTSLPASYSGATGQESHNAPLPSQLMRAHPHHLPVLMQDYSLLLSLLLLFLVFSFPLLCLVFSPVLPCASQHTDIFNISASVSIPFQTEPIFFYLLGVYWATSHFFPSLCTGGIYLCLMLPVFIPRDLVIARLKEPFSVLISLGVL